VACSGTALALKAGLQVFLTSVLFVCERSGSPFGPVINWLIDGGGKDVNSTDTAQIQHRYSTNTAQIQHR
jgi:hypothetical protein